jgi:hypothetical protein
MFPDNLVPVIENFNKILLLFSSKGLVFAPLNVNPQDIGTLGLVLSSGIDQDGRAGHLLSCRKSVLKTLTVLFLDEDSA